MPRSRSADPPALAWDWLARQRMVWREVARRLTLATSTARGPHPDVPDWSDVAGLGARRHDESAARDWSTLRTRIEVIGALRADYGHDAEVRSITDAVVTELAFLGRLDVPLERRGVLAPPRGMRWWWEHLGGAAAPPQPDDAAAPSGAGPRSESAGPLPVQLRLVDVLAGYGDAVTTPSTTTPTTTATGIDA